MAGKLRHSGKGQYTHTFRHSHALVIGINAYRNGIRPLTTPVNDATRLAQLLADEHGYSVHLLVEDVTRARLEATLTAELPPLVSADDRFLLYFAGHGIALDGDDGPQGYLVPQDADAADRDTLLPMTDLHGWLDALPCRHMLAILDCCFAGAFRWASTRHMDVVGLEEIHQERYERFLRSPAWQVLTSAAYDQEALDVFGVRGVQKEKGQQHSPFALALYRALRGDGDLIPKGDGDGLITATELYLYLRDQVEIGVGVEVGHDQTPGLWPLNRHDRGEYVFLAPGHPLNLPPAPELTTELNPWRGLKSYDQEHGVLFFGREEEVQELAERVKAQPFTAVLGASGTGKSSLVKAGLLPHLDQDESAWVILPPLRPGRTPLQSLYRLLQTEMAEHAAGITPAQMKQDAGALVDVVGGWRRDNPGRRLLLVVDQVEELVTLADEQAREQFLPLLAEAIKQYPEAFRLVITLRTDFEPQFDAKTPLAPLWQGARYVVPPLDQADLRQIIEGPASERVLYFEPPELVDTLINEVLQTPGALPLLSFTLSEMYLHYLQSGRDNRALTKADYDALKGVVGSLRNRANAEYEALEAYEAPEAEAHQETMQRVMLRMVAGEGGELARRRVHRSELEYPTRAENRRVQAVLDQLVAARLLVTGEDEGQATVEPAHDALVLAWDRLLRWKQSADTYLPLQRRLAQAATEWGEARAENQAGLLWDDDPRLPQLEETLWPTRSKQEGVRGRLRWARQVMLPNTETPADTKWLNGAEVAFVQKSVQSRARFWRRLTTGVTMVVIAAVVASFILFGLRQRALAAETDAVEKAEELSVANQDLEARLLHSRGREHLDDAPLFSLALGVQGVITATDVSIQHTIVHELLDVMESGRTAQLTTATRLISPVLEGRFLFFDALEGGQDALLDLEREDVAFIPLTASVQRLTRVTTYETIRFEGFFTIGDSEYFLVDYENEVAEIRSGEDETYIHYLDSNLEQVIALETTSIILFDLFDSAGLLVDTTDGSLRLLSTDQITGTLQRIEPLAVMVLGMDDGQKTSYQLRSTVDFHQIAILCGEPDSLIVSDNSQRIAINYHDADNCPPAEVRIANDLTKTTQLTDEVEALFDIPTTTGYVTAFKNVSSTLTSANTQQPVTLTGRVEAIYPVDVSHSVIVDYHGVPGEQRSQADGRLMRRFDYPIERVTIWPGATFFVIGNERESEQPGFIPSSEIFSTSIETNPFEDAMVRRSNGRNNPIADAHFDPALPFLFVELVNCVDRYDSLTRQLEQVCNDAVGDSEIRSLGSLALVDNLGRYPIDRIVTFEDVGFFGIVSQGRMQIRSVSLPSRPLASGLSPTLNAIRDVAPDSAYLVFEYSDRPPELRWRNNPNYVRWRLCHNRIAQSDDVDWLHVRLHDSGLGIGCHEGLIHKTEQIAVPVGTCQTPLELRSSPDDRFFAVTYCPQGDHLRSAEDGIRQDGVERIAFQNAQYKIIVSDDGIATIYTHDDESLVRLGTGSTHYEYLNTMDQFVVLYTNGRSYLVDPELPGLINQELREALQEEASIIDAEAYQVVAEEFGCVVQKYLQQSTVDWSGIEELAQQRLQNACQFEPQSN